MYPIVKKLFGVKKIGIFGPGARGEPPLKKGLDIVVEFEPASDSYRNFLTLSDYLEKELTHPVDLVTARVLAGSRNENTGLTRMEDPDRQLAGRALAECRLIAKLRATSKTQEVWMRDDTAKRAVIASLMIIGQASLLMSQGLRDAHPGVQWALLAGFSGKLFKPYHEPDLTLVWEAMEHEVPPLEHVFRAYLSER